MRHRTVRGIGLLGCAAMLGCGWINTRSDFERDPFVMSHLTHDKKDPLYAGSDNDLHVEPDAPRVRSASTSRKPPHLKQTALETPATDADETAHANDYSWVEGRLHQRKGRDGGWVIAYGSRVHPDRFGGELRLAEHPRLGLAREGDRVRLQGRILDADSKDPSFEATSISFLEP